MTAAVRNPVAALQRLVVAGLVGVPACVSREPSDPRAGTLVVAWIGADTGTLSAPASAEWCDSLKLLEVRAVHGDTGIALVLYPSDSASPADPVRPGAYPVLPPERADSSRPSVAVALRYFAETAIRGFRGDSGTVALEATGPGVGAGRFSAHLRSATDGSKLTITGSFKGLTFTPASKSCAGRPPGRPEEPEDPEGAEGGDEPPDME